MSSEFGWKILRWMQTRPLTFLSFHWNYMAGGTNPAGFHLVNISLHALNAALVVLIARGEGRGVVPWLAGAVFALHPLQSQAVNYVFERATLLAAAFAFLSLLLYQRKRFLGSAIFFAISMLAKEETVALPVLLLLWDGVRRRPIAWKYHTAMFAIAVGAAVRLFAVLHATPAATLGFGTKGMSPLSYALTQSRVIWTYLRLFVLPFGLNLDHDVSLSTGLLSPPVTAAAVAGLAALLGTLAWLTWRGHVEAFWGLGFFILLAPSSSVVPAQDLMFEHRMYFPMVCLAIAASLLLARLRQPFLAPAAAVLAVVMAGGTISRNTVWRDDRSLWRDVVEKSPGKARGYFQLGQTYAAGEPARAREWYERGLAIEPGNAVGHTNLGLVLLSQNEPEAALSHLHRSLELGGDDPLVWNNIGAAELRREDTGAALVAFRKALSIAPCRFDARINLMRTLSYVGARNAALLAGQVPADCHLLPQQARQLEEERRSLP